MTGNFFGDENRKFHASTYFYRVEFQQRGAPHIHSLLWLKDQNDEDAPNFWNNEELTREGEETEIELKIRKNQERMKDIEKFADSLITTSPDDIKCMKHIQSDMDDDSGSMTHSIL